MNLSVLGCSHHRSDISIREQLAISGVDRDAFMMAFREAFPKTELVVLSTCNRTELYLATPNDVHEPSLEEVRDFWLNNREVSDASIHDHLYFYRNKKALRHLFSVAAAMDSMVVGEPQILNQVKQAYQAAVQFGAPMPLTHRVFQAAIRVAKRVATETRLHENRVSIPSVAIHQFAKQIFERLDNKWILVIGAGAMAEETLVYARDEGGRNLTIVNRTLDYAESLARRFGGAVASWESLDEQLVRADLIISTTAATEPIVSLERFQSLARRRKQRPLFILDLAIPRDFDPAIARCLNVYLYSLDDLQEVCEENRAARAEQWPRAEQILEAETHRFFREWTHRKKVPTIRALRQRAHDIKQSELTRLWNRLEGLDEKQRSEIETAFHRLTNKLLHPPMESLREESDESDSTWLLDALKRLFQLGD